MRRESREFATGSISETVWGKAQAHYGGKNMSRSFFGFGIAPSMFPETCTITRRPLTVDEVKSIVAEGVVPCLNPSHTATIAVMNTRFGIEVEIPERAPRVSLENGDRVVVMGVRGLPRLEGRHEYTDEEVENAQFSFSIFSVE